MGHAARPPQKLWTGTFILAFLINACISMVFYLLMTSMALYAVDRFRASDTAAGLASSAFVIGSLVGRLFMGPILERFSRRHIMVASLALFVAASALYLVADTLPLLLALRALHGMSFGAGNTAVAASVQGLIPANRRSEGTGYFALSTTLSTALGPLLAVLLAGNGGYDGIFYFSTACSVAALVLALAARFPEPSAEDRRKARAFPGRRRLRLNSIVERTALPIASVIFLAGIAYSGILSFLASYAQARGTPGTAGFFFVVFAVAVLATRLFAGRLQDRRGDNIVMYPVLAAFAVGLGLLALPPTTPVVAAAGVFAGIGFGSLMPCAQAIVVNDAPPSRMATAVSTFFLMLDAGIGLGPVLLGALLPLTGFGGMYAALGVVVLAATGLYAAVHGRHQRGPRAA